MNPEQARFMFHTLLPQLENEQKTTSKVLAAIPDGKGDYKPAPDSRSAGELGWHIAVTDVWFLNSLADGAFGPSDESKKPAGLEGGAALAAWYDKNYAAALERVRGVSDAQLTQQLDFYGVFNLPAVAYLGFLLNHSIHHRGQLSVYLRPMGAKVPNIYGGSFDEPFQVAADAAN